MSSARRYYDSTRPGTTALIAEQRSKRKAALDRKRQVRDAMQVAAMVYRPGGYNRGTVRNILHERKVIDILNTTFTVENTGTQFQLLNGCVPGSQNYNRIGRHIKLKSLQIHGFWVPSDTSTAFNKQRMLIVYDTQANGSAPTYGDIMKSQNISGTTESGINSMVNLDNRERFRIIRDMQFEFGAVSNVATQAYTASPAQAALDIYIKLGGLDTIYNAGTAGTIGDIQTGALYVWFISDQTNTNGSTFAGSFRIRFEDV